MPNIRTSYNKCILKRPLYKDFIQKIYQGTDFGESVAVSARRHVHCVTGLVRLQKKKDLTSSAAAVINDKQSIINNITTTTTTITTTKIINHNNLGTATKFARTWRCWAGLNNTGPGLIINKITITTIIIQL